MPFGPYSDFADCVASNQDKDDPEAYCGAIRQAIEGNVERASFDVVEEDEDLSAPTYAGGPMWEGVLAIEDEMTGDGRIFAPNAVRWENLPVPLRWTKHDEGEHRGAVVVGRIDEVYREGNLIMGRGVFDDYSPEAREAAHLVETGMSRGISVDMDDVSFEIRLDDDEHPDGVMVTTDARLRAATLVATPAFANAQIAITGEVAPVEVSPEDEMAEEIDEAVMVASAIAVRPPAGWFVDPRLAGATPLTVTDDGRVYGHLATWGTCHTGFVGECVQPPSSATGYAYFRTGSVKCEDGSVVPVGRITLDTTHAGRRLGASDTASHYEHTGVAVADVAAGEDAHGIWIAGAMRPHVTEEQMRALQASPLSGDWRRIGGNLELVAALAVNSPGFPIPRVLVAGGSVQTLQASGVVAIAPDNAKVVFADDEAALQRLVARERVAMAAERRKAEHARLRVKAVAASAKMAKMRSR